MEKKSTHKDLWEEIELMGNGHFLMVMIRHSERMLLK